MPIQKDYDNCKHYGYKKCPHLKKFKIAITHEYISGKPILNLESQAKEEKNIICKKCNSFEPLTSN